MSKRIFVALISLVAAASLSFSATADAAVHCDGRHPCQHRAAGRKRHGARAARQRARARRRQRPRAVVYVCPMHPDIRERSGGTCPKCLMDLVAEPQGAKTGARGAQTAAPGAGGR